MPASGAIFQQKAKDFACVLGHDDFKTSNEFLQGFKSCNVVFGKVIRGESASAGRDASALWVAKKLPDILSHYVVADVYNADKTSALSDVAESHAGA